MTLDQTIEQTRARAGILRSFYFGQINRAEAIEGLKRTAPITDDRAREIIVSYEKLKEQQ